MAHVGEEVRFHPRGFLGHFLGEAHRAGRLALGRDVGEEREGEPLVAVGALDAARAHETGHGAAIGALQIDLAAEVIMQHGLFDHRHGAASLQGAG